MKRRCKQYNGCHKANGTRKKSERYSMSEMVFKRFSGEVVSVSEVSKVLISMVWSFTNRMEKDEKENSYMKLDLSVKSPCC